MWLRVQNHPPARGFSHKRHGRIFSSCQPQAHLPYPYPDTQIHGGLSVQKKMGAWKRSYSGFKPGESKGLGLARADSGNRRQRYTELPIARAGGGGSWVRIHRASDSPWLTAPKLYSPCDTVEAVVVGLGRRRPTVYLSQHTLPSFFPILCRIRPSAVIQLLQ